MLDEGVRKEDRTGTGTLSVFGHQTALRPRRRVSARDDEEGARSGRRRRAHLVHPRRPERALAAGARRHDLGRVGRRARRARAGLRRAVAILADARRRPRRPARGRDRADPRRSRLAPARRQRVERGRYPRDGARAVPRAVPVLRRRRPPLVPALPAVGRPLPRRAVQHRLVRAADAHGRPGHRARGRRLRPHARGRAPLRRTTRPGARAADARAARASAASSSIRAVARSTTSRSTRSGSRATTRTLRSGRRSPSDARDGHHRRRGRAERRDRRRRRAAVASARRPPALQGAHHGSRARDGQADVRVDRQSIARTDNGRSHAPAGLVGGRRRGDPRSAT